MSNTIKALELFKKDLEKIIEREQKKIQKEQEKAAKKLKEIFEEYPSENDVMDAYGIGVISERKKDQLLELFNNKDVVDHCGSSNGLYIEILKRNLRDINQELKYPNDELSTPIQDPKVEALEKEIETLKAKLAAPKKHNARGAGRKQAISDEDKAMVKIQYSHGHTIKELAESFKCSTGLIHKIIHE